MNKIIPHLDNGLANAFIASARKSVSPYESFVNGSVIKEFRAKNPIVEAAKTPMDKLFDSSFVERVDSYAQSHGAVGTMLNTLM